MLFIDSLVSFRPLPLPAVLSLALFSSRFLLRPSSRPRFVVAVCLFFRECIVSRPADALNRRFSCFSDRIPKVKKCADLVDLKKMLQNDYLVAIIAVHTAENELLKV